ncbi:MAG: PAS domain-containing sensor histidine kinase [Balneolaceae bacterium]
MSNKSKHNRDIQRSLTDLSGSAGQDGSTDFEQYLLQNLMNHHPDSIYFKDLESKFTRINHACAIKFGLTKHSEAIGKTDFDFFNREHAENAYNDEQQIIESGKPLIAKEEKELYPGKKERVKWVTTSKLPLYNQNGEIIGTFGISRDITRQKLAEEELRNLNQELSEINRYKDKLFSVIAHDLRNPVAGMLGLLNLVHQDFHEIPEEDLAEYIHALRQNAQNTHKLLEDLLAWAGQHSGKYHFSPEKLNLYQITDEVFTNLSPTATEKETPLENLIPGDMEVEADPNMLKTIIRNLANNAIKFSKAGDKITVAAEREDESVRFMVIDRGVGMSEEAQQKVLNKTVTHTTKGTRGESGSGLGLDLCQNFIEKHNGELQIESEQERGSKFIVVLPTRQNRQE